MTNAEYEALRRTPEARELRGAAVAWSAEDPETSSSRTDRRLLKAALALAAAAIGAGEYRFCSAVFVKEHATARRSRKMMPSKKRRLR
jgi:hypothetical protein